MTVCNGMRTVTCRQCIHIHKKCPRESSVIWGCFGYMTFTCYHVFLLGVDRCLPLRSDILLKPLFHIIHAGCTNSLL